AGAGGGGGGAAGGGERPRPAGAALGRGRGPAGGAAPAEVPSSASVSRRSSMRPRLRSSSWSPSIGAPPVLDSNARPVKGPGRARSRCVPARTGYPPRVETALDALGSERRDAVQPPRYATYAWATLAAILGVILWGAFVRATGSGAGCGSHWPLCNGEVVPRSPTAATLIELGHRVTSGLAALLVVGLVAGAWRAFPRGHAVRRCALAALVLMVLEALIGAGLVLLEHVA